MAQGLAKGERVRVIKSRREGTVVEVTRWMDCTGVLVEHYSAFSGRSTEVYDSRNLDRLLPPVPTRDN